MPSKPNGLLAVVWLLVLAAVAWGFQCNFASARIGSGSGLRIDISAVTPMASATLTLTNSAFDDRAAMSCPFEESVSFALSASAGRRGSFAH